MKVEELIERLRDIPEHWSAYATQSGGSIDVRDPEGPR
jgi:hypothetical protein